MTMASWNYTSHNPLETFQGVNTLTNGLFGVSILVLIWVVMFFRQSTENNRDRIVAANFVTCITAFIFGYIGIINDFTVGVAVFLLIGSIAIIMVRPGNPV